MIFNSDFISTSRIRLCKTHTPEDLDHKRGTLSCTVYCQRTRLDRQHHSLNKHLFQSLIVLVNVLGTG